MTVKHEGGADSELEDDVMAEDATPADTTEKKLGKRSPKTYKIREFFVKWQGKSFWKNSWVPEVRVSVGQLCYR